MSENFSTCVLSSYALGIPKKLVAKLDDRFDLKGRFNANIGSVLNIYENFNFYPGLNFSDGFGVYSEINFPIAKYNSNVLTDAEKLHNQFTFSIGTVFNLNGF